MRIRFFPFVMIFWVLSINCSRSQSDSELIATDAKLTLIDSSFTFTEGPTSDQEGNVYFTDQPNNQIWKWSTKGELELFMETAKRSNGLFFHLDGSLWSCADEQNELIRIDQNKKIEVILEDFNGQRFNGPNDLWIDTNGGIYFTDPYYKRPWWKHTSAELNKKCVFYFEPNSRLVTVIDSSLIQPNGIVGNYKTNRLYVADINGKKIYRYSIEKNGDLLNKTVFVEHPSDGMTLDENGNLYITNNQGVTVFNSSGDQIENIPIPESWTANVCFGGRTNSTLFITASKSIYSLEMKVKGIGR